MTQEQTSPLVDPLAADSTFSLHFFLAFFTGDMTLEN
jgi:hypothetical protein